MRATLAIVNEKGGSGKTTTSVNLAAALGEMGRSVLLVDLDGQAASSRWLGVEEDTSFADALWRGEGLEPIPQIIPGVSLAPGSGKLDSVAHDLRPTQGGQLRKLLAQQKQFDYIVIDCPPSLGNRLIGNALLAASHALVPVECSILALDGLKILLSTLDDIRDGFDHPIQLAGVLACRFDGRTRLSRMILAELKRALPGKVFHTVIRENIRLRECPASKKSILVYAGDSHAAEDYRSLARELDELIQNGKGPLQESSDTLSQAEMSQQEQQALAEIRLFVDSMLHRNKGKFSAASRSVLAPAPVGQTPAAALAEAPLADPAGGAAAEQAPPAPEALVASAALTPTEQDSQEALPPAQEAPQPAPEATCAASEPQPAMAPVGIELDFGPSLDIAPAPSEKIHAPPAGVGNLDWLKAEPADPFAQKAMAPSAAATPDGLEHNQATEREQNREQNQERDPAGHDLPVAPRGELPQEQVDRASEPAPRPKLEPEAAPAAGAAHPDSPGNPATPPQRAAAADPAEYPALRAMLQKMATKNPREEKAPPAAAPKPPAWRRLFKKPA